MSSITSIIYDKTPERQLRHREERTVWALVIDFNGNFLEFSKEPVGKREKWKELRKSRKFRKS